VSKLELVELVVSVRRLMSRGAEAFANGHDEKKKVAAWRGNGLCRSYAAVVCQLMLK
jgi:hypothetical protein